MGTEFSCIHEKSNTVSGYSFTTSYLIQGTSNDLNDKCYTHLCGTFFNVVLKQVWETLSSSNLNAGAKKEKKNKQMEGNRLGIKLLN